MAGVRLRSLLGAHHERHAVLRQLVGTADEELPAGVLAKLDQLKDTQRTVRALEEELAVAVAHTLASGSGEGRSRPLGNARPVVPPARGQGVHPACSGSDRVLTSGEGEQGAFVLCAGESVRVDVASVGRKVAEILGGRGGGSGRIFQGKAALSRRTEAIAQIHTLV